MVTTLTMRILAISDLHTDFKENQLLLKQLPDVAYREDVLIVAGDISDRMEVLRSTLALLRSTFAHVFYVPGNHELWVRKEAYTSLGKLLKVSELCQALDIRTRPMQIEGLWIVPLLSWYQASFDADNSGDAGALRGWADFAFCRWPKEIGEVCEFFLGLNAPHIKAYDGPVISFSHFLPRRDLLPATANLRFKGLPKVAGCTALDEQIRRLQSRIHVFGHSHISCDRLIDGVRYVQNPLRYPKERHHLGRAGSRPDTRLVSGVLYPVYPPQCEA
jgi:predicted phosphodiesterase